MTSAITRREFLKISGGAAAGASAGVTGLAHAGKVPVQDVGRATLPYPSKAIAMAHKMPVNKAVPFTYPDASSPCAAIKMGHPVAGGVGPDGDIVAYSTLCTHMGCPVAYDTVQHDIQVPLPLQHVRCRQMHGQMVCGQATENLPQIVLEYNAKNDAVDGGRRRRPDLRPPVQPALRRRS